MTDLSNQTEKVFKCPAKGCAAMVPASGKEEHKRGHSDDAAFKNQFRQFMQRYGGDYLGEQLTNLTARIDGDGTDQHPDLIAFAIRHDEELGNIFDRLDKLEKAPATAATGSNGGVQVDTWDDPDLTNEPDDVTPVIRINPLTGLPE